MRSLLLIIVLLLGWLAPAPVATLSRWSEEADGEHDSERLIVRLDRERSAGALPASKKRTGEKVTPFLVAVCEAAVRRSEGTLAVGPSAGAVRSPVERRLRGAASPRGPPAPCV